jgi:hypothetical protein
MSLKCPFKVGDLVIYRPTNRGRGLIVMTDLAALKPGSKYKIVAVDDDAYIRVEGLENAAGGGLYWTEFSVE